MKKPITWLGLSLLLVLPSSAIGSNLIPREIQQNIAALKENISNIVAQIDSVAATNTGLIWQAVTVSNIAVQIRSVAADSLGKSSAMNGALDSALDVKRGQIKTARFRSLDFNIPKEMRELYSAMTNDLQNECVPLENAHQSILQTKIELDAEGESLAQLADAIAFTEQACLLLRDASDERDLNLSLARSLDKIKGSLEKTLAIIAAN
ncbi:MAG: hypothetical protein P4L61_01755 [Candidatus Pacebacteria bacterium]|nr:hypothetical protein [Candidatus Paceibacterota bacterium]